MEAGGGEENSDRHFHRLFLASHWLQCVGIGGSESVNALAASCAGNPGELECRCRKECGRKNLGSTVPSVGREA